MGEPATESAYAFDPARHRGELLAILAAVSRSRELTARSLQEILRRHPKDGRGFYSKSELIRGYRYLRRREPASRAVAALAPDLVERLRMKPVRTQSGVAPVTVLTKPFPCPGECVFCPNDVRQPKSYLSDEPGAQRATEHQFDPYRQALSRLLSYWNTGHSTDKVELIVLGGTWSSYPEAYQRWFVHECFRALNDFSDGARDLPPWPEDLVDFRRMGERAGEGARAGTYNRIVRRFSREAPGTHAPAAGWHDVARAHALNEGSKARCVGLVLETRPDHVDAQEVLRLRRLGATKIQLGVQSLDDEVLRANRRGHDSAATRRAFRLLREAGFKIHAHWMPNLLGSDPARDRADFDRLFDEPELRPDELKIYPCSLIETAELMRHYRDGSWRPYDDRELTEVLVHCLERVPPSCRITRMIRDIPGTDIVVGNKTTNFRQVAEAALAARGGRSRDIRAREVAAERVQVGELRLQTLRFRASGGDQEFLQWVDDEDRLAGFLRLQLPSAPSFVAELDGAAVIREVHVYGSMVPLGDRETGRAQHAGLGRSLVEEAARRARAAGYERLAVISAVGTRRYYRKLGFDDGDLYQHRSLATSPAPAQSEARL